jgi:hypothetical protein
MRVSLRKHEHIEALVREEGPLSFEDVSEKGIRIRLSSLEF